MNTLVNRKLLNNEKKKSVRSLKCQKVSHGKYYLSEFVLNVDKILSATNRYKQVSYTQTRHFIERLGPSTKRKKQVQRRSFGLKEEGGRDGIY